MLIIPPPIFRKRRGRAKRATSQQPSALVLLAASYDVGTSVRLTFNRAIDIAAIDVSQIVVEDNNDLGFEFGGTGVATLDGAMTVVVMLMNIGDVSGAGNTLTVGAGNGIVASDDGGPWAGVMELALPFG
jgi:hypothetical protein